MATEEADMDMAPVDTVDPTDPIQLDSVFLLVAVAPESTSVSRIQIPIESISKHFGNPRGAFFLKWCQSIKNFLSSPSASVEDWGLPVMSAR